MNSLRDAMLRVGYEKPDRRRCYRNRRPHYIFTTREFAEDALFLWQMRQQAEGSRSAHYLDVFACGDHWHVGRNFHRRQSVAAMGRFEKVSAGDR
jgi:hypothetical protein